MRNPKRGGRPMVTYGRIDTCRFCSLDIQFLGKAEWDPTSGVIKGGWVDHGSSRFCPRMRDQNGKLLTNRAVLHRPILIR